jgi:cellulose synthase/poly-beta-1,6-N-acetylglucosamine synthase-like glycosyltransferase
VEVARTVDMPLPYSRTAKERILDVWYGKKYQALREAITKGRKHYGNCASCDSMEARYYSAGSENIAISIIVPVYNVSKYLRRCLDSCVFQTLKNIEVIVVNDCSPDA